MPGKSPFDVAEIRNMSGFSGSGIDDPAIIEAIALNPGSVAEILDAGRQLGDAVSSAIPDHDLAERERVTGDIVDGLIMSEL